MTDNLVVHKVKVFRPPRILRLRSAVGRAWGEWSLAFAINWRHPLRTRRDVREKMADHRRAVARRFMFGDEDGLP